MAKYTYPYPKADVTVDAVVFGYGDHEIEVLLIRRGGEPFKGKWALPGGFIQMEESLHESVLRELREETGVTDIFLEQLYTFGDLGRDPRGRVISVAYYALIRTESRKPEAATDAAEARWFKIGELPPLAFDHQRIIDTALERLRGKIRYAPIGFELLPEKFTLTELQSLYETILGEPLDKRNFRKKIESLGILTALKERQRNVAHRAAQLYRFDVAKYKKLLKTGFNFRI